MGTANLNLRQPRLHPSLLEIAWAAGIYEGEGWVGGQSAIGLTQKDPYIVERLQALFGGSLRPRKNGNYDPLMVWTLSGPRARGFAMTIYSLLSPRRQEQLVRGGLIGPFRRSAE